jgi:hypothetical protein
MRLAGMLCIELNDEWLVGRGYLSAESIALCLADPADHTDKERSRRRCPSSKRLEPPTTSPTNGASDSYTTSRDVSPSQASNSSSTARWMINRAPSRASSDSDSRGSSPTHDEQLVDLRLDLRRRRYGTSHGVGPPSIVCHDLRELTPSP